MSHHSIELAPSKLLLAARLAIVLGLSLALWLGLGWGLVTASRLPAAGAGGVAGDVGGGAAYAPALQGTCDITVTNASDSGPGSLRQAIADVCDDGGRITFAGNYTIYLNSTLEITRRLTVDGEAHAVTVSGDSSGDGTPNVQVFIIQSSGVATLTHLNVVSGTASYGGGIRNNGTLAVQSSILSGNSAPNGSGIANYGALMVQASTLSGNSATWGGIYNKGVLTVQGSTLSGNSAYAGGGIYSEGTLVVQDSTLSGNSGCGIDNYDTLTMTNSILSGNPGGGIHNQGVSTVTDSTLSGNSGMYGGGINNSGTLTIQSSTLSSNLASTTGGGIYNSGTLTVQNSTFFSNSVTYSGGNGGGIDNYNVLVVQSSTFSHNSSGYGGGIHNKSTLTITNSIFFANVGTYGGGIHNQSTLTVQNSTFSDNAASAGGGIFNSSKGGLIMQNSTLSGNSATTSGGGISNYDTLTVQNSTLSGNSAPDGGGIYNYTYSKALYLYNTLIANSPSGGDCRGSIATNDHNLIASTGVNACGLTDGAGGSLIGVEPRLGPLANYGGETSTYALLPGSPAIDAGAACLATDQRGIDRPQGTACDIGAFESQGFSLALAGGDNQSTLINTAFAQPLSVAVSSAVGEPVGPGGVITFTAPAAGPGLAPAVLTATTDAGGAAGVTVTANALAGSYGVTATARGVYTSVTFSLTNTVPPAPAMAVLGNSQVITDGDAAPSTADGTDFGSVALGQAVTRTFTISNGGTADLTLTGSPRVSIAGPAALDFSLVVSPTASVAPGATTTFQVRFTPPVTGTQVATITIANDDPVKNPYDFAIQGQGTASSEWPIFLPVILREAP